ncbi:MAG: hypothetical protein H6697_01095, partial [Myxococcales bacterium]|nr:hypothetical protein [Myxococcales bacterium]
GGHGTDAGADAATDLDGSGQLVDAEDSGDTGDEGSGSPADAEDAPLDDTAVPDVDAAEDAPPPPDCEPPERPVGALCRSPYDRACIVDADCREAETCVWRETDRLTGTCIYELPPPVVCPGSAGCESAEGQLRAAFGARVATPSGWELPRPGHGGRIDANGNPDEFVGDVTDPTTFCDCGRDMICPPTEAYADCRSLGEWTAPDADGTEGDGYMQGAWIAGFSSSRIAGLCPADLVGLSCDGPDCCVSVTAHDHVWVRGAVFDQGDLRVAVLSIDAVGYFFNDIERNLAALPADLGVDYLVFASTHTHGAPDTMGRWGPGVNGVDLPTDSGVVPGWMDEIQAAVVDLVTDAVSRLEPVDLYATHVRTGSEGFATRDSRDPFVFTDVVSALRVVRAGAAADAANTLGVFVNWHSHPEAVGGGNRLITGDYPAALRDALEHGLPEAPAIGQPAREAIGGVAVYVSGAVGGLLTPLGWDVIGRDGLTYHDDGFAKAHALGERLADATMAALSVECPDGGTGDFGCAAKLPSTALSLARAELLLPVENIEFQAAAVSLDLFHRPIYNWRFSDGSRPGNNLPRLRTGVAQLRLGAFTMQTVPGELFPEVLTGFALERASAFAIVGNPRDANCAADHVTRLADGEAPRFGCLVRQSNPAPPALESAPTAPGLYDAIPGDYLMLLGNGMDSIGYLIPSYDFVVDPDLGVLIEMPGDHYEEGVSVGDSLGVILDAVAEITAALGR